MNTTRDTKASGVESEVYKTEFSRPRLARAYIPFQVYRRRFDLMEGFQKGTIFPELFEPYTPKKEVIR
jgi:hypothetical protein